MARADRENDSSQNNHRALKLDAGEIWVNNRELLREPDFYHKVQLIFQNPKESFSYRMSILQAVKEPLDIENKVAEKKT